MVTHFGNTELVLTVAPWYVESEFHAHWSCILTLVSLLSGVVRWVSSVLHQMSYLLTTTQALFLTSVSTTPKLLWPIKPNL